MNIRKLWLILVKELFTFCEQMRGWFEWRDSRDS